jgi:membrane protein DedA with SNARE-associated domain
VEAFLAWLSALPIGTLYVALAAVAAIENVFPPIPADTVVALGSFLAAQGRGSVVAAFIATWTGNVGSAMVMYAVGWRYGASRLERRLVGDNAPRAKQQLERLYGRYGAAALFASRFIPGVRALVPPCAGALRVPPWRAAVAIGSASAIWYGTVSYLGFTLGGNWRRVMHLVADYGRVFAFAGAALLLSGALVWWTRGRKVRQT